MSLYYIKTIVTLKEKAIFSKNLSPGNIYYTFDYIPGSILWGSFASKFPKKNRQEFYNVFFQDKVIFTNLYPLIKPDIVALPIPLSTFACKYKPGWQEEDIFPEQKHGFHDYLLDISKLDDKCSKCQAVKKNYSHGFYYKYKIDNVYYNYTSRKSVDMHNHIDDELQSTKEVDGLYSYEVLTKGQKFLGYLILKGEWENFKEIRKIYNSMNNRVTSIGKGRNNGYGLSVIEFIESESCQLDNKRLYVERKLNFSDSNKFTLTLLSDLILKSKHHNSYYTYINEEVLCKILNDGRKEKLFEPVNFKLIRSFCRTKEIDGFNMHHGLPKNKMIGLTKGSSFLFKYNISDSQSLGQILLKVERNGLGLRRSEGYGMVAINLPYHKENLDK